MHIPSRSWLVGLWATGLAAAAAAQGPAFDCAKAQGEVEKQVCSDPSLAARDRQLASVYQAAAAKATGKLASTLRAEQRGWVKGRNDCWKARQKTWITATWTVDTVAGCIDAQYRLRTAELQAVWQLLPARTVSYACGGNAAHELVVRRFDSDPATLRLERGDRSLTLWQVGAPADGLYEGRNVSLRQQGAAVTLTELDTRTGRTEALDCQPR